MTALKIMEDLEEASTPGIIFDKENNQFEIWGNSLPEDLAGFYQPVYNWVREYIEQPNPKTKLLIKPNYFNSSSFKAILDILSMLEVLPLQGYKVEVEWQHHAFDDDVLQTGKELQGLIKNIPFRFVSYYD